jgi:hypothetical protein
MKRFQLVDALGWEKQICSVLYEADVDDERFLKIQADLSAAMNQPLEIIDTWTNCDFPATAEPLLRSEAEVSQWLKKHERNVERQQKPR